jgi:uncharacterized protein (TIGR03437 family)
LGGKSNDEAAAIALDGERNAYVLGTSNSSDFPITPGAIQPCPGFGASSFLAKVSPDGTTLAYSTFLSGSFAQPDYQNFYPRDYPAAIAIAPFGAVWLGGSTVASDFPVTPDALQPAFRQARTGFLSEIDFSANRDFTLACVANAANLRKGPVSPGVLVALFGDGIGPNSPAWLTLGPAGKVSTSVAGVKVLFDGIEAPLTYVQAHQVNAVVPYGVAGKSTTQVQVEYQGRRTNLLTIPVLPTSFGIFTLDSTGSGQGAILNEDGTVNSPANPAAEGSVIAVFATGAGQTIPAGIDGAVTVAPYPAPRAAFRAYMNFCGATPEVQYYGAAPGLVAGVVQINLKIPVGVCRASYPNQVYFYGDDLYPAQPVNFSLR